MKSGSVRRGISSVGKLVAFAGERGVSRDQCLRGSGIVAGRLEDPTYEIDAGEELLVVRNLLTYLGDDPSIGVEVGRRYRISDYGIWGYALLSSQTLASAMALGLRYIDLTFAFVGFRVLGETAGLTMVLDDEHIDADCRGFLVDRDAAAALMLQRDLLGGSRPPARVSLKRERPHDPRPWIEAFGPRVTFGAADNRIEIDERPGDLPLPQANPITAELCERQCRELLSARERSVGCAEKVRQQLLTPGTSMALEAVAASLAIAPRTLRRRLAEEGTTFRALVDEVRQGLAEEMLRRSMTVEETAERLGYAEAASFVHAFKRWTGLPPGSYRRRKLECR